MGNPDSCSFAKPAQRKGLITIKKHLRIMWIVIETVITLLLAFAHYLHPPGVLGFKEIILASLTMWIGSLVAFLLYGNIDRLQEKVKARWKANGIIFFTTMTVYFVLFWCVSFFIPSSFRVLLLLSSASSTFALFSAALIECVHELSAHVNRDEMDDDDDEDER